MKLTALATALAADIAANIAGAGVAALGYSLADEPDLQILVQPMDQTDEAEDRDGEAWRRYSVWVVTRQKVDKSDAAALAVLTDLVLSIAERYEVNADLEDLSIAGMTGVILYEKPFFPLFIQEELDLTDFFHSVLVLNFYERST